MAAQVVCKVARNIIKRQQPKQYPQWKLDLGREITQVFESNPKVFVLQYNALNSQDWQDFRYLMNKENVKVKKYPNQITKVYLERTAYANLSVLFCTDTCVAYGDDINMKSLLKILDTTPKIELVGAKIDETLMDKYKIVEYSKLPSLDQSRSELVQILSQPARALSRLLSSNQASLSMSLEQYVKQQSESE